MQIAFWASALLVTTLSSATSVNCSSIDLPSGGTTSYSTVAGKTRLDIRILNGVRYIIKLKSDQTVSPKVSPNKLTIIGEIGGTVIIFIDAYPSTSGGLSYRQAGEEKFLRIVAILKKAAVETFQIELENCRDNIELATHSIDWNQES